jgi:hypothetical protein
MSIVLAVCPRVSRGYEADRLLSARVHVSVFVAVVLLRRRAEGAEAP